MVIVDKFPDGEKISNDFSVWVNGHIVPVLEARVSAIPFNRRWPGYQRSITQSEIAYFARFETDGPVDVKIIPNKPFKNVIVRPKSKGIKVHTQQNTISFTVNDVGGYTVELDGFHNALHLFVDPVKIYDININDKNVLYFGPGIHDVGMLQLQSNQTVYIDAGAIVYATIHAKYVQNIRILGRGILDNSKNVEKILFEVEQPGTGHVAVKNSVREHTIRLENVRNAEIDGITIRDSLVYNISTFGCEEVLVNNVKIIGCWRYNTDGIDLHNSSHCVVRNCFVRTYDDSICVKGHVGYPQVCEDILVENCTIWNDWGCALEIGAETCAEQIRNITFRNCDIIRNTGVALDVKNVDYGDVHDILFENIRVEYDPVSQRPQIQESEEQEFAFNPNSDYIPPLIVSKVIKHHEYSEGRERRGKNRDIVFRNIRVISDRMPPSEMAGYDEEHPTANIRITDLYWNNKKFTSLEDANIKVGPFAYDITIN